MMVDDHVMTVCHHGRPDGSYGVGMGQLRRIRIDAHQTEVSALSPVTDNSLSADLGAEQAWWLAHDEGGLGSIVSLLCWSEGDDPWSIEPVRLLGDDIVTDAEALTTADGCVFVVGSGFVGPDDRLDERRSFILRVREADVVSASNGEGFAAPAQALRLGQGLMTSIHEALVRAEVELLATDDDIVDALFEDHQGPATTPINIEGAAFCADDLVIGLRWPVTSDGHPILAVIHGARQVLTESTPSVERLLGLEVAIQTVDAIGSARRPAGIRGLGNSSVHRSVELLVGPTDRQMADDKVKSAAAAHVRLAIDSGSVEDVQRFEGFRKVEGLAPSPSTGDTPSWMYALDDDDAIVLLLDD